MPDSAGYRKAMGIDIEAWLAEGAEPELLVTHLRPEVHLCLFATCLDAQG